MYSFQMTTSFGPGVGIASALLLWRALMGGYKYLCITICDVADTIS